MEIPNKADQKEFHAVEFMRQVRNELSERCLHNKTEYLEDLKNTMSDFKRKQEKAYSQQACR